MLKFFMLQLTQLFPQLDKLHRIHGSQNTTSIYGAGKINNPNICIIFMNPTAKNISAHPEWKGLKVPWIGTRNVWKLLFKLGLLKNQEILSEIIRIKPYEWNEDFALKVYEEVERNSLYLTNIAKCTQDDARHIPDSVYREYSPLMKEELKLINPKFILTFGNQVNSILLQKPISVSQYMNEEFDTIRLSDTSEIKVYPCYYPVGQGTRNINKAMERMQKVLQIESLI